MPVDLLRFPVPRAAALLTAAVLALTACSSGSGDDPIAEEGAIAGVEVTGAVGEAPEVSVDTPLEVDTSTREVLVEGDGDEVRAGDTVTLDLVLLNGTDEREITNTFGEGGEPVTVIANNDLLPGFRKAIVGTRVGSRVVAAITPEDAFGDTGDPANGIDGDDALVLVADIVDVRRPLARAQGTPVDPPAGLPKVTVDDQGAPTITVPNTPAPTELVVQPLIEGTGAVVESGQTITVHYTGVLYGTGEVFDSSWEGGAPTEFAIGVGQVISGWDKGLVGQKVGSQILLVIPPAEGYGPDGEARAGISGTDTLVFVVDILDAS